MQETWCADARTVRPEGWCLLSPWRIFQWCGDACHTIYCRQLNNLDIHKVEAKKVASDGVAEEKSWKVLSLHVIRDTIRVYETFTSTRRRGANGGWKGRGSSFCLVTKKCSRFGKVDIHSSVEWNCIEAHFPSAHISFAHNWTLSVVTEVKNDNNNEQMTIIMLEKRAHCQRDIFLLCVMHSSCHFFIIIFFARQRKLRPTVKSIVQWWLWWWLWWQRPRQHMSSNRKRTIASRILI